MSLLQVNDVESGYGDVTILNGVNLEVRPEEIVSIIGPNGAGKSTLLKTIMGLVSADSGSIIFRDTDITDLPPEEMIREGICYVPQSQNIFLDLSVWENLKMGSLAFTGDFQKRVAELQRLFPILEDRSDQRCAALSGGQQQMVALASALVVDPDILILDEPSAGLAPQMIDEIFDRITKVNEAGTAVLMVEQNARRSLNESDRGVVLAMGKDEYQGQSEELLESEEIQELYLGEAA